MILSAIKFSVPIFFFMILTTWNGVALGGGTERVIFPDRPQFQGKLNAEWLKNWWIWWVGMPDNVHPFNQPNDSRRCSMMQGGPVWYMPSALPGRYDYVCNVPYGKDLMFVLTSTMCDKIVDGVNTRPEFLQCVDNMNTNPEGI